MVIGRGLAGPVVHRLNSEGRILISAFLSGIGFICLAILRQHDLPFGALVFRNRRLLFLAYHVGFVSENLPETGAVGISDGRRRHVCRCSI